MPKLLKFFLGILLLLQVKIACADAVDIYAQNSQSVIQVVAMDSTGSVVSQGSGVVIQPTLIATNLHVVENAFDVQVISDGTKINVLQIYHSLELDISLLVIDERLKPTQLSKRQPSIGEKVYALGNPLGLSKTFSDGIVSGLRGDFIQVTTAISPGSSGGALIDSAGNVIGITTFKVENGENLNFAISSTAIFNSSLIEHEKITVPLIDGSYLFDVHTLGIDFSSVSMIKRDALKFEGNLVYATIISRTFSDVSDTNLPRWIETRTRRVSDCTADKHALLSFSTFSVTGEQNAHFDYEVLKWDKQPEDFYSPEYDFVCSLRNVPRHGLDSFLAKRHAELLKELKFQHLRFRELYDLDADVISITPLGQYLLEREVNEFKYLDELPELWMQFNSDQD